jgi:cytochrome b pre-mRNA-processing protein 3
MAPNGGAAARSLAPALARLNIRRSGQGATLPGKWTATSMLRFLFPRLTAAAPRGSGLFGAVVREARQPHWFVEGLVPDTLDGRFAVLATLTALATVRLERGGPVAGDAAVALAERFVEAMDSEHRQLGVGDPTLGKTVRKLMGALGRRVELWRTTLDDGSDWRRAVSESMYREAPPRDQALTHSEGTLRAFWQRLEGSRDEELAQGRIK